MSTKLESGRHDNRGGIARLEDEFRGVFALETIERYIEESTRGHWLPLMAERFARERLRALGQAEARLDKPVPEVLFVCVRNSARSQMAAGLLNKLADGRLHVRTAGSEPAEAITPQVRVALGEVGVDVSQEFPKPLTSEFVAAADVVITMGCGDACPVYPGKRYEDWDLEDPAGLDLEGVRRVRDEIEVRVDGLASQLLAHE